MKLYGFLIVLLICGCTTANQQSSIAALEVGLATAETAATAYKNTPAADAMIVVQMKTADNTAYAAIKAAEATAATGAAVDLTAASAALSALEGLIATLPKGE